MRYPILVSLLLTANLCLSQTIKYNVSDTINFTEAKESGKLIFITLHSSDEKSRRYLESGLHHQEAGSFYHHTFFNYLYDIKDAKADFLVKRFKPKIFPTYYFLDFNGDLIYRDSRFSTDPKKYLAMAGIALKRYQAFKSISAYKQKFESETINKTELKEYISLKMSIDSFDNAELIERYADFITDEELNDLETVSFILKAGPLVGGKAFKKAFKNKDMKNLAFRKTPEIRTRMRSNTMAYASENKDISVARRLAGYHQFNYNKAAYKTERYSPQIMMEYYRNVKDTANYLAQMVKYYDDFIDISQDSAKKHDTIAKQNYLLYMKQRNERIMKDPLDRRVIINPNPENSFVNIYAKRLNDGALLVYNLQTYDPKYLYKGISWSRKASELAPQLYSPKNTLAKLLYRAGFYDEAEKIQTEAIAIAEKIRSKTNKERFEKELQLMRNRVME